MFGQCCQRWSILMSMLNSNCQNQLWHLLRVTDTATNTLHPDVHVAFELSKSTLTSNELLTLQLPLCILMFHLDVHVVSNFHNPLWHLFQVVTLKLTLYILLFHLDVHVVDDGLSTPSCWHCNYYFTFWCFIHPSWCPCFLRTFTIHSDIQRVADTATLHLDIYSEFPALQFPLYNLMFHPYPRSDPIHLFGPALPINDQHPPLRAVFY